MNNLIYLIPVALLLGLLGLVGFMWSIRSGQYDDLDGAAHRILEDEPLSSDGTGDVAKRKENTSADAKPPPGPQRH